MPRSSCSAQDFGGTADIPSSVGHVYFIQQGEDGPIKIGATHDIQRRLLALQQASPQTLYVRQLMDDPDGTLENQLHIKLRDYRIRGEWFWPAKAVLAYILRDEPDHPKLSSVIIQPVIRFHITKVMKRMVDQCLPAKAWALPLDARPPVIPKKGEPFDYRCKVCKSPHRTKIENAVLAGVSYSEIERSVGVPRKSVASHQRGHRER